MVDIKTNHQWRDTLRWHDLAKRERIRFDWLDTPDKQDEATFIRYKGFVYSLDEFMRSEYFPGFDGYMGDSYFSGVLIKLHPDMDRAILATFFS